MAPTTLKFTGHGHFRSRLILSTLTGRQVRFEEIRPDDLEPGLKDFEVSFLRLLEKLTNGSVIEISYTGTTVLYRPGILVGGKFSHECCLSRALGYFLEPLIFIAPLCKSPVGITLTGITSNDLDIGVDTLRTAILPLLKRIGVDDGLELRILKRGAPPLGGGEIHFTCSKQIRHFSTLHFTTPGKIKRIRGIASSTRVSPAIANRLVESTRSVLNRFIPDIYIYTDVYRGQESGKSPGFALSLVAESTTGCLYSAETTGSAGESADDIGIKCARMLLCEIEKGGCVDTIGRTLLLQSMVLASQDLSKIRIGSEPDENMVQLLRDMQTFFATEFILRPDVENGGILVSCKGVGYQSSKKVN
ncbi:putative RNA 3'-terminal phosphate cyclase-like protein [Neolecta irregularis DAH-3]|uniref:Putative RNA 3'-terminal phosphate cyclase-like protein n=1 Tax=Neolecta irregularis (strain DAH-3) TaxID=1198029 RepID=A0A1U7LH09_NEOID|nr:putative RNA 3'-terminal phosphate cyclase-like protein [Neolecta irregularis DAH-3]|eukprot:OLL21934.1 putative RNA 3'-terminal phosphate cyclase-like protein [Neolecta irregularis DAH-3]